MSEESIAEIAPEKGRGEAFGATDASVDATQRVDPEDFDFEAFLAGVRPTRRAVRVYARADLVADMEEIAGRYRDDLPAAEKRKIKDEVIRLREEFEASGRWFVAESRSQEWVAQFRKDTAARLGLDLGPEDATMGDLSDAQMAARQKVTLEQAAAQVVVPRGATAEGLARLGEVNEGELNKIITAVAFANSQQAQSAGVLTRDFSRAPSAPPPRRGSTKR